MKEKQRQIKPLVIVDIHENFDSHELDVFEVMRLHVVLVDYNKYITDSMLVFKYPITESTITEKRTKKRHATRHVCDILLNQNWFFLLILFNYHV